MGGAYGNGHAYEHGQYVGDVVMTQVSVGLQAGGQACSQIIFFADQRAVREFTHGNFEFDAGVSAVAITAAGASMRTAGSSAGVSGGKNDASTARAYRKGMAVFTIVEGGAMYETSIAGQK